MPKLNKSKKVVIIIIALAIVVFFTTLYKALFYAATDEVPLPAGAANEALANQDGSLYPAMLSIPKLNINAEVVEVGITSRGNMGTPNNYANLGWYKYGILPGEVGSAVMAGHVDNGLSLAGVFSNLKDLEKGDGVFVTNKSGVKLSFVVSEINTYDFDDRNTNVFTKQDGKFLKLVTKIVVKPAIIFLTNRS